MNSVLDHDLERLSPQPFPMTDLLRTYLQQSRGVALGPIGAGHRERIDANAQDLWDYLGDFA